MTRHRDKLRTILHLMTGACLGMALMVCGDGGPPPMMADTDMGMGGPPGPMAAPMKVITAAEDAAQIETGMVDSFSLVCQFSDPYSPGSKRCGKALDGPFVLTDVRVMGGGGNPTNLYMYAFVAEKDEQLMMGAFKPRWSTASNRGVPAPFTAISGMRLLVKAGEKLYFSVTDQNGTALQVLYSGFRPY